MDALCACKILQALFKADDVPYTTVPVQGKADLQKAFSGHSEQVKVVVLINCGATLDVQELLQPEQDVRIYIVDRFAHLRCFRSRVTPTVSFDSHRPVNLDNVYNKDQVTPIEGWPGRLTISLYTCWGCWLGEYSSERWRCS